MSDTRASEAISIIARNLNITEKGDPRKTAGIVCDRWEKMENRVKETEDKAEAFDALADFIANEHENHHAVDHMVRLWVDELKRRGQPPGPEAPETPRQAAEDRS